MLLNNIWKTTEYIMHTHYSNFILFLKKRSHSLPLALKFLHANLLLSLFLPLHPEYATTCNTFYFVMKFFIENIRQCQIGFHYRKSKSSSPSIEQQNLIILPLVKSTVDVVRWRDGNNVLFNSYKLGILCVECLRTRGVGHFRFFNILEYLNINNKLSPRSHLCLNNNFTYCL